MHVTHYFSYFLFTAEVIFSCKFAVDSLEKSEYSSLQHFVSASTICHVNTVLLCVRNLGARVRS